MTEPSDAGVAIRPATARDEDLLLHWANDPVTRAASFRPEMIPASAHRDWLAGRIASPTTRLLIGQKGDLLVGQVRFERERDGMVEVGISVAPGARGRGVGPALLLAGLQAARRDPTLGARLFVARVRVDNEVSARLFEGAGFRLRGRSTCDGVPCIVFEIEA